MNPDTESFWRSALEHDMALHGTLDDALLAAYKLTFDDIMTFEVSFWSEWAQFARKFLSELTIFGYKAGESDL